MSDVEHDIAPTNGSDWTCPMHPGVSSPGPGSCPECGMALEPRHAAPEDTGGNELTSMRRRFWVSVVLTVPVVIVAIAFAYNGLGVPVAAGVLYPITGLLLSPMLAAAAMSLSSVSVIANALRLHRSTA